MNFWMEYELRRIRGEKPVYPAHNAESFPPTSAVADAQEWDRLRKQFGKLLDDFTALANSSPQEMQRQIQSAHDGDKKIAGTLEDILGQMISHNSYHVGQIAMLRRMMDAWPPRGGGDTW